MWFIKWIIQLIIALIILAVLGYGVVIGVNYLMSGKMSSVVEKSADEALQTGINIPDSQNDLIVPGAAASGWGEDQNQYYRPYLDIVSVRFGTDKKYLYFRANFGGKIPEFTEKNDPDPIKKSVVKVILSDESGKEQSRLEAGYNALWPINMNIVHTAYFTNPTGIENLENVKFADREYDGLVGGGPGKDYITGAFPLAKLGIKPGQRLFLTLVDDNESENNEQAARDVLRGNGSNPARIIWDIGTNFFRANDYFYR